MAVAHDEWSESHTGTTGSASEASFSWTHSPTGTPKGVLVFVFTNADASDVTSVTYGGVTVPAVTGGEAADTANEPGRCKAFFLGSSIPTGDQTIVVNRTNNADVIWACAATQTALGDTEYHGVLVEQENQALTEENIDDGSPGTNSLRYVGINSGAGSPPSTGANTWASLDEPGVIPAIDYGARVAKAARELAAGQGSRPLGFVASGDDVAAVYLAVREAATTPLDLDLGDIPASSAAHGIDLSQSGAVTLSLGDVPSASAAQGVDLTAAGPLALSLGDIPSTEVVRGIDLAGATLALELGDISSAEVVQGIDLTAAGPLTLSLGRVPQSQLIQAYGIDLTASGPLALSLGDVPSTEVVQGIDLTAAGPLALSLGAVPSEQAIHGIDLDLVSAGGEWTLDQLSLGSVASESGYGDQAIDFVTDVDAAAGSWVFLPVSWAFSSVLDSVTDDGPGLDWQIVQVRPNPTGIIRLAIVRAWAPAGLPSGTTISLAWSTGDVGNKVVGGTSFLGGDADSFDAAITEDSGTSSAWTLGYSTGSDGELIVGVAYSETGAAHSPDGTALEYLETTPFGLTLAGAYDIAGAAGSGSIGGTWSFSSDWGALALKMVPAAAAALTLDLGDVPSAEAVQGIDLTIAGPLALSLGDIPAGSAAHGIDLAAAGALPLLLGNVPAADVAHGINLAQSGPISLPLGKITGAIDVQGITLSQSGAVSLLLGNVASAELVQGIGLVLETPEKTVYVLQADFETGVRVVELESGVFAVEFEGGVGRLEYEGGVLLSEYSDGVKVVDF